MSPEQLARLPSWAVYNEDEGVIELDPDVVYPKYMEYFGWSVSKYSMTMVRRIVEEQLLRAVLKACVVRYHAAGVTALTEPMWMEDARFALAALLPASDIGTQFVADNLIRIRILRKRADWDIRNASDVEGNGESRAQSAWLAHFFPTPLP